MSCSTDRTYTLAEVQAYLRKAHEKGKAAGEAAVLHGLRTVSALNGSGLRVLKTIRDAEGYEERRRVEKSVIDAAGHVHGTDGRFISTGEVHEAATELSKGNSAPADELRKRVKPEDAAVLEERLANPGHTPEARAFHPAAQSAGHKRGIGEEHGEAVAAWVTAVTAAIRHGADYDHGDVQRGIERAVSGQTTKLRRVLRVLDPETLVSHQPATKEGVQRKIREIISTAIHAAKDIRAHVVRNEAEQREKELHEHAVQHALHLRDAVGHLQRMEGWQSADPASPQPGDAVHAARERIAALLGHEEGAAVKAFKENPSASVLAAIHGHDDKALEGLRVYYHPDGPRYWIDQMDWHDGKAGKTVIEAAKKATGGEVIEHDRDDQSRPGVYVFNEGPKPPGGGWVDLMEKAKPTRKAKDNRPTAAIDLDGTLATYDGWKGSDHFGEPRPGAKEFLAELSGSHRVLIFTTRTKADDESLGRGGKTADELAGCVREWLDSHGLSYDEVYAGQGKPLASVYVDDRAIAVPTNPGPDEFKNALLLIADKAAPA